MALFYKSLLIILLILPLSSYAQDLDKKGSIGFGLQLMPEAIGANTMFLGGDYERYLKKSNSFGIRAQLFGYDYNNELDAPDVVKKGSGGGGGIGIFFRHYFSENNKGFYLGPALEFALFNARHSYEIQSSRTVNYYKGEGDSKNFGVIPNLKIGYRIAFGETFSANPSIILGYRYGSEISKNGDFQGDISGGIFALGIKMAWQY